MSALPLLSSQPWVERLGWTLLSFLWQGALIAVLYAAIRGLARSATPHTRYLIACVALAIMVAAPLVTWSLVDTPAPAAYSAPYATAFNGAKAPGDAPAPETLHTTLQRGWSEPFLPWVVGVWLSGSMALWLRLLGGWMETLRLSSTLVQTPPPEWQMIFMQLKARARVSGPVRFLISSLIEVPSVVGWLKPVVLIPAGTLTGLPPEQIEALILHELAHIRRRDYLVNILQNTAEALLFYHPAVWWVSGHIRTERELCCDDVAVSLTGDALAYAQALADLEASRSTVPRTALAASGGSLSSRIARLLGQARTPRRLSGSEAIIGLTPLAFTGVAIFAQSSTRPKFEVASIKPAPDRGFMTIRPAGGGRLTATAPVGLLIQAAYSLQAYQVIGGPSWLRTDRYEIEAKGDGNPNQSQLMLMLQSLLEERFQLKAHSETRDLPAYALVLAKSGAKLPRPKEGSCRTATVDTPPPPPDPAGVLVPCGLLRTTMSPSGVHLEGGQVAAAEMIRVLAMVLDRPVVDKTGLTGTFDVKLDFVRDGAVGGLPRPAGVEAPADPAGPTVFSAIQEQLGLKLDGIKSPVEVLVVDRVERPTGN